MDIINSGCNWLYHQDFVTQIMVCSVMLYAIYYSLAIGIFKLLDSLE